MRTKMRRRRKEQKVRYSIFVFMLPFSEFFCIIEID
jgi:hypothetical protein